MPNLAIIVPLYNPHNDWYDAICNSIIGLDTVFNNIEYSIILVNDGSTQFDESHIENLKTKGDKIAYLSYPVNKGKGYSIRYGLSKTQADYYVYTDIDFPFGYEAIKNMYEMLNGSSINLVIGTRNDEYYKLLPFKRRLLSKAFQSVSYILTGFRVHDTQAGIKGFDNEAKRVFLATKINGFLFDLEFIRNCLREKLHFAFINIHPRPNIRFSDFRTNIIKQELRNLNKIIFRY